VENKEVLVHLNVDRCTHNQYREESVACDSLVKVFGCIVV
jgi:hypothetical protein